MRMEAYAATRPQDGRRANEDAFLIGHGAIPHAALCDGAGHAQQAARRALTLAGRLLAAATPEQAANAATWAGWIQALDASLPGGHQSTFVGVAVLDGVAIGACAGDSRAYLIDRDGACRILTDAAGKQRLGSGEARAFPIRQPLTSGDTLLLLSDGAWTPLSPYLLTKAVMGTILSGFPEIPDAILDAASRTGRPDDMTAVAIRVK